MDSSGALMALVATDTSNRYFFNDSDAMFNFRDNRITEHHSVVYGPLLVDKIEYPSGNAVRFVFQQKCDAVSMVDLVIRDPKHLGVGGIVEEVWIEIGGQRIDRVCSARHLEIVAAIHGRSITVHNDTLFIPIALAPFHDILPLIALKEIEVNVYVKFKENASLLGDSYFLGLENREWMQKQKQKQMMVAQSQSCGGDTVEGGGLATFNLNFNHPVSMIYFLGCDKNDIVNVQLLFNKASYYDGPIEPLERMKDVQGLKKLDQVVFFFFSRKPLNSQSQSTVNMSKLDSVTLRITTRRGSKKQAVNIHAINVQNLFSGGLMAPSKQTLHQKPKGSSGSFGEAFFPAIGGEREKVATADPKRIKNQ